MAILQSGAQARSGRSSRWSDRSKSGATAPNLERPLQPTLPPKILNSAPMGATAPNVERPLQTCAATSILKFGLSFYCI